jgi:hypothetical protein
MLKGRILRPSCHWIGAALLWLAGCAALPPNMGPLVPVAEPDSPLVEPSRHEAMFPSLKLNEDLFRPLEPSNNRDWAPEGAVLAQADLAGHRVTVHHIRDCHWRTLTDFTLAYYDKTFDLDRIRSVDFIVVPFNEMPSLGHTMLSFGFDDGEQLVVSVEIRRERGETFNPIKGFFRQYELMYVVASERDAIQRRVNCDLTDVYLYHTTAKPAQARKLFVNVMHRVDKLYKEPEFYDTLTNNCTTNIRNEINQVYPNRIPYDYRVLLPGYSDELAYDLELIKHDGSYQMTRDRARINYLAYKYRDDPAFSQKIRAGAKGIADGGVAEGAVAGRDSSRLSHLR